MIERLRLSSTPDDGMNGRSADRSIVWIEWKVRQKDSERHRASWGHRGLQVHRGWRHAHDISTGKSMGGLSTKRILNELDDATAAIRSASCSPNDG